MNNQNTLISSDNEFKIYTPKNNMLTILLMGLGFFLNQSSIIFGVNLSISDFIIVGVITLLIVNKKIEFPMHILLFLFTLLITTSFVATYIVPIKFSVTPELQSILIELIKLLVNFIYLFIGYNLAKIKLSHYVLDSFALGAIVIAIASLLFTSFNVSVINDILFYGEIRFRGLMNDPNYFSVLQNIALAYIITNDKFKLRFKPLIITLIIISIFLSGSKTGIITLLALHILLLFKDLLLQKFRVKKIIKSIFLIGILLLIVFFYDSIILYLFTNLNKNFPVLDRVAPIFIDFESALNTGGSGRGDTWKTALSLIMSSPLFGVGVGTYTLISNKLFNIGAIAHNTFLQIGAEWGLLLTSISLSYLAYLLLPTSKKQNSISVKLMMIIILIGGLAISLQNARIFWFTLGILIFQSKK